MEKDRAKEYVRINLAIIGYHAEAKSQKKDCSYMYHITRHPFMLNLVCMTCSNDANSNSTNNLGVTTCTP